MSIDPKDLLAQIRSDGRPLMKIHVGQISEAKIGEGTLSANEYVEEWLGENHQGVMSPIKLENDLVEVCRFEHDLGWAFTEDDAEAWELERRVVYSRAQDGDESFAKLVPHLYASDGFHSFGWHGKWYHYGCQSIDIEDKYAASLCATKIATSELEHVQLPWPCFIVRVPKFLQDLQINSEPLRLIVVNHMRYKGQVTVSGQQEMSGSIDHEQFSLMLLTANKYRILPCKTLADWAEPRTDLKSVDEFYLTEVEYNERDRRQLEIIGRLVLGAVIAMNDPKGHKSYGKLSPGKKPSLGSPRYGTNEEVVLHKLGRPVKVDARETLSAYVNGHQGRVTNVRTLVAGHWKNQPHGPKSSFRRWQHIECYWRGAEDAPMIIRPHTMTGA